MYRTAQIWSWIRVASGQSSSLVFIRNASSNRTVEDIYQRKTPLEHVLLRPEPYIGSVDFSEKAPMWVFDSTAGRIVRREISYVPGLYKIFDEILVNAADNKRRDPKMSEIRVDIDRDSNEISIYNNGRGVPVQMHRQEKKYVPELIFGTLLTSSNYDDTEKKVTGGRHGYGAKLCNIFSNEFTVETQSRSSGKKFRQTWTENMSKTTPPEITDSSGEDFTKITFQPDLSKFRMNSLDEDIVALMCRRAFDVAGVCGGVRVILNGEQLKCSTFPDYVAEYLRDEHDPDGNPLPVVFEHPNDRWEIGVALSDRGFQQVSFVNSIATTNGGRHVDHVLGVMLPQLIEGFRRKADRMGIQLKPHQIRNHLWLFVNCLIENPTFDSQTKETLTLSPKKFGSECSVSESFLREVQQQSGIMEAVASWVRFRELEADSRKSARSSRKITGLPKLEDANNAGGPNSADCSLILTEGDSAKSLAVAGLSIVGRDNYGVYPLRGKMLNVRDASAKQLSENAEVSALVRILGLQYRLKYESEEERKTLRYGRLLIMADQDQDGSHIKGLVINFIHCHWPALLRHNFIQAFITPIVKVWRSATDRQAFYSMPEYAEWRSRTPNWRQYRVKYYKGLGTSSSAEVKDYFAEMPKNRVEFAAADETDESAILLAFGKDKAEQRKDWLTEWMERRRRRRETGQFEEHLYSGERRPVRFQDFVNKELVLFSNADNERSIPSLMDGLKPGQRKVLFTCFKRADKKEMKVSQLAGAVAEMSAYHHGEASLMSTIVNMAQNFVGSNNLNLLLPIGQFGTRLQGGRDAASPRYIYTQLNPLTRLLFPAADDPILRYRNEDNQWVEPDFYAPILPTVLINGAEGIGTAWATKIPMFSAREVLANVRRLIRAEEFAEMRPSFRGFEGTVKPLDGGRFCCEGKIQTIGADLVEISELPVGQWTYVYKETVLEPMRSGEGNREKLIMDFKEYHTEDNVRFVVRLRRGSLRSLASSPGGLINVFKLRTYVSLSQMILFDSDGVLRKFLNVADIFHSHFHVRRSLYEKRKQHLEAAIGAAARRLDAQRKFVASKTSGELLVEGRTKSELIAQLKELQFPADPMAEWREAEKRRKWAEAEALEGRVVATDVVEDEKPETTLTASDYDYLLGMQLWRLTAEEVAALQADCDAKISELETVKQQSWAQMWEADLDAFEEALNKTPGHEDSGNDVERKRGRPRKQA